MRLQDLYQKYHQEVQFLVIYIKEAHSIDGWWLGSSPIKWLLKLIRSRAALDIYFSKTTEGQRQVAQRCADTLDYNISTLVDEVDDAVN